MPAPTTTLLIEGSFEELADELGQYIDDVQQKQNPNAASVKAELAPLISSGKKTDVLKKLVTSSAALNAAPERGEIAPTMIRIYSPIDILCRIHRCLQPPSPPRPPSR